MFLVMVLEMFYALILSIILVLFFQDVFFKSITPQKKNEVVFISPSTAGLSSTNCPGIRLARLAVGWITCTWTPQ